MPESKLALAEAVSFIRKYFVNREDVHAQQRSDGSYVPCRWHIDDALLASHVQGHIVLGTYFLNLEDCVTAICIDLDDRQGDVPLVDRRAAFASVVEQTLRRAEHLDLRGFVEFSGRRGYHVWFLFQEPFAAALAQRVAREILVDVKLVDPAIGIEVFPKQAARTAKGLGNLVKLPLGRHRLGSRSEFVQRDLSPLLLQGSWLETQAAFLRQVPVNSSRGLEDLVSARPLPEVSMSMPAVGPAPEAAPTAVPLVREFMRTLDVLQRDHVVRDLFRGDSVILESFPSRSEAEWRLCVRLLELNVPEPLVQAVMAAAGIGKWRHSPPEYAEITLRKAREWVRRRNSRFESSR